MDNMEDDPWADLRKSSQKPEAGRFAYNDEPSTRAQGSFLSWLKLWLKVDVARWWLKQLPLADKSLDSSYYLGINTRKKIASNAVKKAFGKESQPQISRTPIIISGRRIGIPGLLLVSFGFIVIFAVIRTIFGF